MAAETAASSSGKVPTASSENVFSRISSSLSVSSKALALSL